MTPFQMIFHKSGHSRERKGGLGDIVAWVGLNALGTVRSLLL